MNADKMFEELGYKKEEKMYHIFYTIDDDFEQIILDKRDKMVVKTVNYEFSYLSMQELKAINKKCEELKWI